jgi:hypothetical protein
MGNGALPHGPSCRTHPRLYRPKYPVVELTIWSDLEIVIAQTILLIEEDIETVSARQAETLAI